MNLAAALNRAIVAAGVPILGVSIGHQTDRSTWLVCPPDQQRAAQPIIDSFDPADPAVLDAEHNATAARLADDVVMRALSRVVHEELQKMQPKAGVTVLDLPAFRDRVRQVVRQLIGQGGE